MRSPACTFCCICSPIQMEFLRTESTAQDYIFAFRGLMLCVTLEEMGLDLKRAASG